MRRRETSLHDGGTTCGGNRVCIRMPLARGSREQRNDGAKTRRSSCTDYVQTAARPTWMRWRTCPKCASGLIVNVDTTAQRKLRLGHVPTTSPPREPCPEREHVADHPGNGDLRGGPCQFRQGRDLRIDGTDVLPRTWPPQDRFFGQPARRVVHNPHTNLAAATEMAARAYTRTSGNVLTMTGPVGATSSPFPSATGQRRTASGYPRVTSTTTLRRGVEGAWEITPSIPAAHLLPQQRARVKLGDRQFRPVLHQCAGRALVQIQFCNLPPSRA